RGKSLVRSPGSTELELEVGMCLDVFPPHPAVRPDEHGAGPDGESYFDPVREPARQLLGVGPRAIHALGWRIESPGHSDHARERGSRWGRQRLITHSPIPREPPHAACTA